MDESTSNPENWFTNHKNHWFAFLTMALIYSVIGGLTDKTLSHVFILAFFGSLLMFVIGCGLLSVLLLLLIRLFKGNFRVSRFMDITAVVAFVMVTFQIISLALNFVTGGR